MREPGSDGNLNVMFFQKFSDNMLNHFSAEIFGDFLKNRSDLGPIMYVIQLMVVNNKNMFNQSIN